jgi:plasmid stability protein
MEAAWFYFGAICAALVCSKQKIGSSTMNLSVKNVTDDLVERLRLRAQRNHRSLQGEMLAILENAVSVDQSSAAGGGRYASAQAVESSTGLHDARQTFIGRAEDDWAQRRDRAAERAIELMQRGLAFGDRRFTRDEMHER